MCMKETSNESCTCFAWVEAELNQTSTKNGACSENAMAQHVLFIEWFFFRLTLSGRFHFFLLVFFDVFPRKVLSRYSPLMFGYVLWQGETCLITQFFHLQKSLKRHPKKSYTAPKWENLIPFLFFWNSQCFFSSGAVARWAPTSYKWAYNPV